jgi:peptidyl-prolyl cis-trans isomerase C
VKARLADLEQRAINNVLDGFFKKYPEKEAAIKAEYDRQKAVVDFKEYLINYIMVQATETQVPGLRADVTYALENIRQSVIINSMLADFVKKNPVTESEIKAEFDRYKGLRGDTEYRVRHILVASEDEAKALIAKIKSGSAFASVAKTSSKDGSAAKGGDLGWASPSNFVPPFSQAMVAMQKGTITEVPVKSPYGFHIIKLDDTRSTENPPLEAVKEVLTEGLQKRKLQAFREYLVQKANIQ